MPIQLPAFRRRNRRTNAHQVSWNVHCLEPRLMLAGDAGAAVAEAASTEGLEASVVQDSHAADPSNARCTSETIVFIDSELADADRLVAGITRDAELVLLDADTPLLAQISEHLRTRQRVKAVHVVTHGSVGTIVVGEQCIEIETLRANGERLATWADALTADADILIYGCNTGSGQAGTEFIAVLAELTGADVAASNDLTGKRDGKSIGSDADWQLEQTTGLIESAIAFDASTLASYQHTLDIAVYASGQTGEEQFELRIDDNVVQSWNATTSLQAYTFETSEPISASRISVHFVNDLYQPEIGFDRNLTVTKVDINGNQTLTTNDPTVYSTGTWRTEDQATPGWGRGDTLHTNGAFFYGQDISGGPLIAAGASWQVNDPNGVARVEPGTNNLLVRNEVGTAVWTLADIEAGQAFRLEMDSFVRPDSSFVFQTGQVGIDYFDSNHNKIRTASRASGQNTNNSPSTAVIEDVAPQNMEYATIWGWIGTGQPGSGAELVMADVRLESIVSDDTTPPTATLTTDTIEVRQGEGIPTFTVIYRDDQPSPQQGQLPIRFTSPNGISVTGPNDFQGTPNALGGGSTDDPNEVFVAYGFALPRVDLAEGEYTVTLQPGHVTDIAGNPVPGGVLGTFQVVYVDGPVRPDDLTPPTVSLLTNTVSASASLPSFTLEFNDTESELSFVRAGAEVRVTGPNGYNTGAIGYAGGPNQSGGLFELFSVPRLSPSLELGVYTVTIDENYVIDQGDNGNLAAILGSFSIIA